MKDNTTELTMKEKKKRKNTMIASIVSFSIIGVLILVTILLAVIPAYTGVKFKEQPDEIHLYIGNSTYQILKDDADAERKSYYNKIWNSYLDCSSTSVISTIFGGYAGKGMQSHYNTASQSFSNLSSEDTFKVVFRWNDKQTMINPNGSQFTHKYAGGSVNNNPIYFKEVHFAISNENAVKDKTFYINTNTTSGSDSTSTRYTYTGVANYNGLYNVLNQMEKDDIFEPVA